MDESFTIYKTWPWYDYGNGLLWTTSVTAYTWCFIIVGLAFGLVQNSAMQIIIRLTAVIFYAVTSVIGYLLNTCRRCTSVQDAEEGTPLLESRTTRPRRPRKYESFLSQNPRWSRWYSRILSAFLTSVSIAYAIGGSFLADISTGNVARSESNTCGLWTLRDDANNIAQDADALIQGGRESRAGQYARNCYGPQSAASPESCQLFRESVVKTSQMDTGLPCPFVNDSYCAGNRFTATRFSTGLVDASLIGINAENPPKFNRTTICVPLNMDLNFAKNTSTQDGYWAYDLGPVESEEYSSNYTFEQYGDPFLFDVRSYTMKSYTHVYSKTADDNYWKPIPALTVRNDLITSSMPYSLTIMFIHACRIFYQEHPDDFIFRADGIYEPGLYYNKDSRARPLACFDWIEACTNEGNCSAYYLENSDRDDKYNFMRAALNKSTTFYSIGFRGANGLDAQHMIQDDTSLPLAKEPSQWVVESWALFNTSLSRIQYDALDVAYGVDHEKEPLYVRQTKGDMCGFFTLQLPKNFNNIAIVPVITVLVGLLLIGVLGWETDMELEDEKRTTWYTCFGDGKLIFFEWACWRVAQRLTSAPESATTVGDQQPPAVNNDEEADDSVWRITNPGDSEDGSIDERLGPSHAPVEIPSSSSQTPRPPPQDQVEGNTAVAENVVTSGGTISRTCGTTSGTPAAEP